MGIFIKNFELQGINSDYFAIEEICLFIHHFACPKQIKANIPQKKKQIKDIGFTFCLLFYAIYFVIDYSFV